MIKKEIIANILEEANIHHNISISWSKMPDYDDDDIKNGFKWEDISEYMLEFCVEEIMMNWPENDRGNRLHNCIKDKHARTASGACKEHDLWNFYTYGRSGATLYWEKYWKESNSGLYFRVDEINLEEMLLPELKEIYHDIKKFNKAVKNLMLEFYGECKYKLEEIREEKKQEEEDEKEYQKILATVKKRKYIKRLVNDII